MRLFVGLDVSLAKAAICVIGGHGKIMKEAQVASEPEELVRWIGDLESSIAAIGLEAGPLLKGFEADMAKAGQPVKIVAFDVPGAFEMPLLAKKLGESGQYDAIVAAALVVDSGIYRHEFVAQAVVTGLMDVQLATGVPVFSVSLTPHKFHATPDHHNFFFEHFIKKGAEAANAVRMVATLQL